MPKLLIGAALLALVVAAVIWFAGSPPATTAATSTQAADAATTTTATDKQNSHDSPTGTTDPTSKNPTTPLAPPPLPQPETMTDHPALATFIDKTSASRFGSDFEALVPTITDPNDIAWALYVLRDHTDLDVVRNEAANLLSRSHVPKLEQHLLAVLESPYEKARFQSYAVQHLGNLYVELRASSKADDLPRSHVIYAGLVKALNSPHLPVRSEALLILARERDPRAAEVIRSQLATTTTDYPQELLINCAKDAELSDLLPAIRPFAYDANNVVRIAAIQALAQWRDETSRPAFEDASRSTVPRLKRAGALALTMLDQQQQ